MKSILNGIELLLSAIKILVIRLANHGWLSVEYGKPKYSQPTLVTVENERGARAAWVAVFRKDDDGWCWVLPGGNVPVKSKVIGWKKMPRGL